MGLNVTHTFVKLPVSERTFNEIYAKLLAAHYVDQIHNVDGDTLIDMHGLAITKKKKRRK